MQFQLSRLVPRPVLNFLRPNRIRLDELDANWRQAMDNLRRFTPDMQALETQLEHPLFVVDELQDGMPRHGMLKGERRLYTGFTQTHYTMLYYDAGEQSYPLVFERQLFFHNLSPILPIRGVLYGVSTRTISKLDVLRQNGVQFERKRVMIVIPLNHLWFKDRRHAKLIFGDMAASCTIEGEKKVFRLYAYMYFARQNHWQDGLDRSTRTPEASVLENKRGLIKRFYAFTDEELGRAPF